RYEDRPVDQRTVGDVTDDRQTLDERVQPAQRRYEHGELAVVGLGWLPLQRYRTVRREPDGAASEGALVDDELAVVEASLRVDAAIGEARLLEADAVLLERFGDVA